MKTVLAHGVFDFLHIGHIEHLREAKAFGDFLIVSVVPDEFVVKDKRPMIFDEATRVTMLSSIRYVDKVLLCKAPGPQRLISELRPDFYVRGQDYVEKEMPESALLARLGIAVRFTESNHPRTTDILSKIYTLCRDHPEFT